jgi:hypothetical protein
VNIVVRIERLVVEGLELGPGAGARLQMALEVELARRLAAGGLALAWQAGGAVPALPAAEVVLPTTAGPVEWGRQIAAAVYAGLGPPGAEPAAAEERMT